MADLNKDAFEKRIKELRDEIKATKEQYVKEHARFNVGDKVCLDGAYGVIEEINADDFGDFCGFWRKFKKDGEPYAGVTHFYSFSYRYMKKVESKE